MSLKQQVIEKIIQALEDQLIGWEKAANEARETATHSESVAENKYDTFGLEAAYLAEGLSRKVEECSYALRDYKNSIAKNLVASSVRTGCIVHLINDNDEVTHRLYLGAHSGGLKVKVGAESYLVIMPQSPLGSALINKELDEEVTLPDNSSTLRYISFIE